MAQLDMKEHYDYDRMRKAGPLTSWEDIHVGEAYHRPPTIIYPRRDFYPDTKGSDQITGKMYDYETKTWKRATMYRNELSVRYVVKKLM